MKWLCSTHHTIHNLVPSSRYAQHWACMHSHNLCMMYSFPISHRRQHKPTNLSTLTFIHTFMAIALFQMLWSQRLSCCIVCSKYGTIAILNQMKKVLPTFSQQICLRFRSLSIFLLNRIVDVIKGSSLSRNKSSDQSPRLSLCHNTKGNVPFWGF